MRLEDFKKKAREAPRAREEIRSAVRPWTEPGLERVRRDYKIGGTVRGGARYGGGETTMLVPVGYEDTEEYLAAGSPHHREVGWETSCRSPAS